MSEPVRRKRVFIVGCRRSGTTWTMLLLAQHPRVVALQQIDFFRRLAHLGRWFATREAFGMRVLTSEVADGVAVEDESGGLSRIPLSDVLSEQRFHELVRPLAEDVYERFARCNPDALAVVEQTPEYVECWRDVFTIFPDAYFLHVVRDPRSVFCSHRNAAKSWADPTRFSYDPVEVAGEWCRDVSRAKEIARATDRYLEIGYEDLRREPEPRLARIHAFLGLPTNDEQVAEAVAATAIDRMRGSAHAPRGFFRKGEVEGWRREMSRGELQLLEYVAGELMGEFGYEPVTDRSAMPLRLRLRLAKQGARERLTRWAWESNGPFKRGTSRVLKALPGFRRLLLRNLKRSA